MSTPEPLILRPAEILSSSSSSGMGMSYWSNFMGCGAKNAFSKAHPGTMTLREEGSKISMMHVGVFFHKLRELWRLGKIVGDLDTTSGEGITVEWGEAFEAAEWKEACRLFRAYTDRYSRDEWRTVSAEEAFEFGCRECAQLEPCSKEGVEWFTLPKPYSLCYPARDCIRLFGVPCISGRYDEVASVDNDEIREKLIQSRSIPMFNNGIYIVDAKSKGQRPANLDKQYEQARQFTLYNKAWTILHPDQPSNGMIVDAVYAYKTAVRLETFLVENNSHKEQVLHNYLSRCWRNFLHNGYETNPDRCFDYNMECWWMQSGRCNQL